MTPEKQRIAIAEACGWKEITGLHWIPLGIPPTRRHGAEYIPDYLNDLNAIHEAEKVLTDEQAWKQIQIIVSYKQHAGGFPVLSRSESVRLHSATAAQRAESFLRTIGKWKGDA